MLPTASLSQDGVVLGANEAFCSWLGRPWSELEGRRLPELGVVFDPPDAALGSEAGDARVAVRRADGRTGPAVLSWRCVREGAGRPAYLHVVVFDETPRVEAEHALAASEARWTALVTSSADIGWTADADCTILGATPSLLHQLGWREEDVRGRCGFDFVHQEDLASFREAWEQVASGQTQQVVVECRLQDASGRWRWVRETLTDRRDDPHVRAITGNVIDVSQWREDRLFRAQHEHRYRARFEQSPVPQATLDERGAFEAVNRAMAQLIGREAESLLGQPVHALNHPEDPGHADQVLEQVLGGRLEAARAERVVAAPDGRPIPVLADLNVLRDARGEPDGVALFWHDLTLLHDAQRQAKEQAEFFEGLSRRANDLALVLDADGRILYASPAVLHNLGYEQAELVSLEEWRFVHPDDLPKARRAFLQVVRDGGSQTFTIRTRSKDGRWHWVEETVTNLLDTSVQGVVWNGRDVTDRVEAENALRASEARYRAIADTGAEGIWAVDERGRTLYVNRRMAEILGLPQERLYEIDVTEVLEAEEAEKMRRRLRQRGRRGVEHYEVPYPHPDGTRRILAVASTPLEAADGHVEGSLGMVSDVTDARRAEDELRHAALHDALTGLPNRTLLLDRLERALTREQGETAVMFVDVDHFKLVNDSRGHAVGDELLVAVAARLLALVRPTDTVARFGGDEFVVVCEDVDEHEAEETAARVLTALGEPIPLSHGSVHVTASVGLAVTPPRSAADLLRFADSAMYAAKAAGRARIQRFDRSHAEEAEQRYSLASDLRQALANDELEMHYQPVVDLATGAVLGVEALARWQHPEHGVVPPTQFVAVAELFGLSHDLDTCVLSRSLREAQAMRDVGLLARDVYVAVNLSARNLSDPGLERRVVAAVEAAGTRPSSVLLEITESAIMEDAQTAVAVLTRLRTRGFQIAIDDFGTGYSSLAYLRDLPITVLKVDRSFVAHISEDRDALAIVASIVDLARAVGVGVVAEGVETLPQAALLRRLGCTAAQGWLWSRALPPAEVPGWAGPFAVVEPAPGKPARPREPRAAVTDEHGLDRLLSLHREGASLVSIASALNKEGYRTPSGRRWHSTSVARTIAETAYPALRDGGP